MGPQPLPWGSSSTMKMLFLQSLQRPKWAASQVALSFSTRGLSTAQWSVTTAASMADMPTKITTDVILTLVACSSNMLLLGACAKLWMCVHARVCSLHVGVKCECVWIRWSVCIRKDSQGCLSLVCLLSLSSDVDSRGSPVLSTASLHFWSRLLSPALLSTALSFSFSALCLVVGKKGPDNSALVSTSLLSSSPSLVAFGELRTFSYKTKT